MYPACTQSGTQFVALCSLQLKLLRRAAFTAACNGQFALLDPGPVGSRRKLLERNSVVNVHWQTSAESMHMSVDYFTVVLDRSIGRADSQQRC
jgi:hypothetical protein